MSSPPSRLHGILGHLLPSASPPKSESEPNVHQLSPTYFLERAAAIEPDAEAIYHQTADGAVVRRTYAVFADRARGLAYYLLKRRLRRVGVLAPNTPAFLETIYGVPAAGGVLVPCNYRLSPEDVAYIMDFADVEAVVVDAEFVHLLDLFRQRHPNVPFIVDSDTQALRGPFDDAVREGLAHDVETGGRGWAGLKSQCDSENDTFAIPFTSGTTSRPKGVEYTHRGAYLAAMGNVIEAGLNFHDRRCKYLWTLPMFHAMGWTFPWAICAVRGTNVCLRKIDYPLVWKLLREEAITHFNAAPTVNTLLCASPNAERLPHPVRVTIGASPPSAHLLEQMNNLNLHPVHVYGMTETYGPITKGYYLPAWDTLSPANKFAKWARQGHGFVTSLPVRVVKHDQPEGVLIDVARNGKEIGEIVFFGNICAKGYHKDPEATRKLFAGGALHSGDLAVWHPDGSILIQDRAKDIIISGGENISSVALESMLVEHEDVLEASVIAVPDPNWGETPKAYVTVKAGKQLQPRDLIDWAKNHSSISKFMVPREVEVVENLPKTSTGKIQKNVLREWTKNGRKE